MPFASQCNDLTMSYMDVQAIPMYIFVRTTEHSRMHSTLSYHQLTSVVGSCQVMAISGENFNELDEWQQTAAN